MISFDDQIGPPRELMIVGRECPAYPPRDGYRGYPARWEFISAGRDPEIARKRALLLRLCGGPAPKVYRYVLVEDD